MRTVWHKVKTASILPEDTWTYQQDVLDGHLTVMCGREPAGFHLSISHRTNNLKPGRYPTWDEIIDARYRFCPPEATMAMLLPPKAEYVNLHETCFHLWEIQKVKLS